jgi:hypothetical protein
MKNVCTFEDFKDFKESIKKSPGKCYEKYITVLIWYKI